MSKIQGELVACHCFSLTKWLWRKSSVCCPRSRSGTFPTGHTSFSLVITQSPDPMRVRRTMPASGALLS